ncbi:uncharacterized protein LOC128390022 [Panonychus citri]|uniref:uncharacterized protein LOC128390022 n=1 Tax=Panonychus citri TaxID=50023 RepID=UPI002307F917|nr:uncharacterized protein LOC128390022 [Panonychus citri]
MSPYEYHEFNEQEKIIQSYWRCCLERKTTREAVSDLLGVAEKSAVRWYCIVRGYEQIKPIAKGRYIFELFLDFIGAIILLRGFLMIVVPFAPVRIALGDPFIGSTAHGIQIMLVNGILILACGLRYHCFAAEKRGPVEAFQLYHRLRATKFDHKKFKLTSADCSHIRKLFFLFIRFYLIITPLTCLAIAGWLGFAFIANPINYDNLTNFVVIGVWTVIVSITITLGTYPSYWIYIQNTLIMVFVAFALNSNQFFGQLLVKSGIRANQNDIFEYFSQQNKIYNTINRSIVDLGSTFSHGVIVASGLADFAMFVSIWIGTGSDLFDYLIFAVGITIFSAIVMVNILAALTVVKVSSCHLTNYQIARYCKLNLSANLKLLATCERMNVNQIGFTLGGIFTMNSHSFMLVGNNCLLFN